MKTDRTMSLGRNEIDCLTETLQSQQDLLQKLYNELDVERESSAIAADEALSMILRLQGEKSAVGMEAIQYKRVAEEKICHAQETLEIFQDLIYQKEIQIAYLEFQVQAYKFKLASAGSNYDSSFSTQYSDNVLLRSSRSSLSRRSSFPPLILDALSRRVSSEGEKSTHSSPKPYSIHRVGDFTLFLDDIMKLDERVKELVVTNDPNEGKLARKHMLLKYPTFGVGDFEFRQLNRRIKGVEEERRVFENNEEKDGVELQLLREIRDKVESIEAQLMSLKTVEHLPRADQSVGCIREVMRCFWPWSKG